MKPNFKKIAKQYLNELKEEKKANKQLLKEFYWLVGFAVVGGAMAAYDYWFDPDPTGVGGSGGGSGACECCANSEMSSACCQECYGMIRPKGDNFDMANQDLMLESTLPLALIRLLKNFMDAKTSCDSSMSQHFNGQILQQSKEALTRAMGLFPECQETVRSASEIMSNPQLKSAGPRLQELQENFWASYKNSRHLHEAQGHLCKCPGSQIMWDCPLNNSCETCCSEIAWLQGPGGNDKVIGGRGEACACCQKSQGMDDMCCAKCTGDIRHDDDGTKVMGPFDPEPFDVDDLRELDNMMLERTNVNENRMGSVMDGLGYLDSIMNQCCAAKPGSPCCDWPGASMIPTRGEGENMMYGVPDSIGEAGGARYIKSVIAQFSKGNIRESKSCKSCNESKKLVSSRSNKQLLNELWWIAVIEGGIWAYGMYTYWDQGGGGGGGNDACQCCANFPGNSCCLDCDSYIPAPTDPLQALGDKETMQLQEQIKSTLKEQLDPDTGRCDEMFSSNPSAQNYEPNCVKCFSQQQGGGSAFNANITGPNCECCEGDDVTPEPGDGDRCENCCCEEIDIGVGVCKPGTEVMPNINFPNPKCDCSLIGLIDAPAGTKNCKGPGDSRGTLPTVGVSKDVTGPQFSERLNEIKRFKDLAGISKKK